MEYVAPLTEQIDSIKRPAHPYTMHLAGGERSTGFDVEGGPLRELLPILRARIDGHVTEFCARGDKMVAHYLGGISEGYARSTGTW